MLGGKAWFAGGAADVRPSLEDGILVLGDIGSRNGRSGRGSGRRGAFITPFEALCKLWNGLLGADEPVILQFACPLNELGAEGLSDVARIYVLACSRVHLDDVLTPVLRQWHVFEREDLRDDGDRARDELAAVLQGLDVAAKRSLERRARRTAAAQA